MDFALSALAPYGATLTPDGHIQRGDKVTSVQLVIKGKRLLIEGGGHTLASGPAVGATVARFVEGFWFWTVAK